MEEDRSKEILPYEGLTQEELEKAVRKIFKKKPKVQYEYWGPNAQRAFDEAIKREHKEYFKKLKK